MEYKYPPVYKYGIYLVMIYAFLKHQNILPLNKLLFNSVAITLMIISLDYIIIKNHPQPFETDTEVDDIEKKEMFDNEENDGFMLDDEIESIIDACDSEESEDMDNDPVEIMHTAGYDQYDQQYAQYEDTQPKSKYSYKKKNYGKR